MKRLRRRGYSINELVARLSIPKTTVWHHIHAIQILPKFLSILNAKRGGNAKRKEENWTKARIYAQKLLQGQDRDFAVAIAMLYWGEGTKKVCEFIKSDGRIIKIYLHILRKVLSIAEDMIQPTMRIYSGMNRNECLKYWSKITSIPAHKFIVRLNDGGTQGRVHYGMCRITIRKGSNVLKLFHSLIDEVFNDIIIRKN